MRDLIEGCLKNWRLPIPPSLRNDFLQYQYKNNINFIRLINIIANLAFLSYAIADYLVVPDIASISIISRTVFFISTLSIVMMLTKRLKNIVALEFLLPSSIIVAAAIWFELLLKSTNPSVTTYLYASVIFVLLSNIGIRVNFLCGLLTSFLLSGLIFYYVNQLNHSNGAALFIYTLVYLPVLFFSLFISWHAAHASRQLFLYSLIEALDKSDLQAANRQLWTQSHTDSLTGVANRELLEDRTHQALIKAKRDGTQLALMFLDLDEFKPVNDNYGHSMGDLLLKEVAKRMTNCVRESDTVARIGGDEFVVLLPVIDSSQGALNVAEKIRVALGKPFDLPEATVNISASIGFATYPEHGSDIEILRRKADAALYRAKALGRNRVERAQSTN